MLRYRSRTSRLSLASALFVALALGCTEETPLETPADEGVKPSFAPGTSLNVNLDQCANLSTPNCTWQNGDLNKNNSAFSEGDVVPFRLAIEGLTPGTHTIHINYDFTAGGHKAYDFLASVDATESVDLCAVGGGGVSSLCAAAGGLGTANVAGFPADPFNDPNDGSGAVSAAITASALGATQRELRLYGGTINSIVFTPPSGGHSGSASANSTVDLTIGFTSTGSAALFVWGGHLAQSAFWKNLDNSADGAGEVSGAPWHMRTQQLDGAGNKNQDRSIQPSAIVETHPAVTITKTPNVTQVCSGANTSVTYTYVVTNTGDVALSGSVSDDNGTPANTGDDIAVGTFNNLAPAATASFTSTRTINATTTNIATVTASDGTTTVSNTATATVTAVTCGLSLTKTPDKTDVCTNGGNSVTYTYVVTNNSGGGFTATGTVTDDNGTPANTADDIAVGTFTNLAAGGGQQTFTHTRTITATTTNIATANATVNGQSVSTTATATVTAHTCSITITKTPAPTQVCSGVSTSVTYTYVVTNTGDFFTATGTVSDDNGTPANTADDIAVGSFTNLAPSGGNTTLTHTKNISATTTNIATATGTSGGASVSNTATATVTAVNCGTGLLAPTQTTCEQFASGNSPDLEPLQAGIKNQKINNIAPGVFFFYASITPQSSGNLAIQVNQTVNPNPFGLPEFTVAGTNTLQAFVYTFNGSSCTKVLTLTGATDPGGTLSATAGTTYIIGVKYSTSAPVGSNVGDGTAGQSLAFYSFAVGGFPGAADGADLFRKNTTP